MRLISLLLYLIAPFLQLTTTTSLHAHLKSLKGLPSTDAKSTNTRSSKVLDSLPEFEIRDSIATSGSHEGGHSAPTSSRLISSLSRWGSPLQGGGLQKLEHSLDVQITKRRSSFGRFIGLLVVGAILITLLSFVCACFGRWWDADDDEMKGPDPTLAAVEYCNGPWAVAYRQSNAQQREAIELLFKCNIITMPEFAGHGVSRQHSDIDACVQIAMRMLDQRRISEWEAHWQEAHRTFEQAANAANGEHYLRA